MDKKTIGAIFAAACQARTKAIVAFDAARVVVYNGDKSDDAARLLQISRAALGAIQSLIDECNAANGD